MSLKGKAAPAPAPLLKNAATAPVVFFDNAPVFGAFAGHVEVELAMRVLMPKADGNVNADMVCTGHLRCSAQAAVVLVDALTKALDMLTKQQSQPSDLLSN